MLFEENMKRLYGQQGQVWLNNLKNLVDQLAVKWGLSDLQPLKELSYNYILAGMQKEKHVILKLGFDKSAMQREAAALKCFEGHKCIKVLGADMNMGALLLERAVPGQSLKSLFPEHDEEAIKITCKIMDGLHRVLFKESKQFQHISDWLSILDKDWDIPRQFIKKARELRDSLLQTPTQNVLLHGDLHHGNILSCEKNKWIAIDPKGIIGEPAYEVGAFIRNPMPTLLEQNDAKNIIQRRIMLFAKNFNLDEQRIWDWVYVQTILSACWMIEDDLDPGYFLNFVQILLG